MVRSGFFCRDILVPPQPLPARLIVGQILRLLLICLGVGLIMEFFHIRPEHLLEDFADRMRWAWDLVVLFVNWAVPYVLRGASIVVPVGAIILVWRLVRR